GLFCTGCGIFCEYRVVKSNEKGNKGQVMVSCNQVKDSVSCNFFWWKKGLTWSPTASPALTTTSPNLPTPLPTLPTSPTATFDATRTVPNPNVLCPVAQKLHPVISRSVTTVCPVPGCNQSCIHPDFVPSTPELPPATVSAIDAQPNPHHVSHMPPIFTDQYHHEQELLEKNHVVEAQRQQLMKQSKHGIVVYAWAKDDESLTIQEFQAEFQWPHFVLTSDILSDLTLSVPLITQLFQPSLSTWVNVKPGYVITVKEGDHVFLKASQVKSYLDFNAGSFSSLVHLHYNFPGEHAYRWKELLHRKQKMTNDGEEQVKAWPPDFYVTDIITYFHAHKSRSKSISADVLFHKHFGLAYPHSTVYDHLAQWKAAFQSAKDAALAACHTPTGL
ncbi:hypothetical protein L208DRAFT_1035315, partial [Tricholoma matsutake]